MQTNTSVASGALSLSEPKSTIGSVNREYTFHDGYPTPQTAQQAYDDADLNRAIEAYKFFYPSVSILATWKGNEAAGVVSNKSFLIMQGSPHQLVFTPNSDTPYAGANIDLSSGPMVAELPAGPLMCVVNDLNQRYVMDMGIPGPDAGKGGRHLLIPPGYTGKIPEGYFTGHAHNDSCPASSPRDSPWGRRAEGHRHAEDGEDLSVERTCGLACDWSAIGDRSQDFTPVRWEKNLDYWKQLAEVINQEPAYEGYRMNYGQLASLGIEKGKPFEPDARMERILVKAAQIANDQMRVQSFGDRRPDRVAWPDRKWEWASLRPENGTFDQPTAKDLEAREKWFYQAQIESPAMFRRTAAAGSLYWLGVRDSAGAYLDGSKTYKLTVPQPVPAKLFWSVTVYDPDSRSEILTDTYKAALRSMYELKDTASAPTVELYFGPTAPAGREGQWIKTIPGKGWFTYFRIYGPGSPAFDGSWKPGDFEKVK